MTAFRRTTKTALRPVLVAAFADAALAVPSHASALYQDQSGRASPAEMIEPAALGRRKR